MLAKMRLSRFMATSTASHAPIIPALREHRRLTKLSAQHTWARQASMEPVRKSVSMNWSGSVHSLHRWQMRWLRKQLLPSISTMQTKSSLPMVKLFLSMVSSRFIVNLLMRMKMQKMQLTSCLPWRKAMLYSAVRLLLQRNSLWLLQDIQRPASSRNWKT